MKKSQNLEVKQQDFRAISLRQDTVLVATWLLQKSLQENPKNGF